MDKQSNETLDTLAVNKQLALFIAGSGSQYESYKRAQNIKNVYPNDLHYYNDTFYFRHDRNIQEIGKIKELYSKGIIKPEMLVFNSWNCFYPSYILNHHFKVYAEILKLFSKDKEMLKVLQKALRLDEIGLFAQKIINTDFGKPSEDYFPTLNKNGEIQMKENFYFYDKHISLYCHVCCFLVKKDSDDVLVFVKVRNSAGQLNKEIKVRDFGQRISLQYLQIGYNFDKIKPCFAVKRTSKNILVLKPEQIIAISNTKYFDQFNLSLLDLKKSLYLAIKYTQMRLQFKTIPESKQQRPIITYQAVGARLVNAYSKLVCLSELNKALLINTQIIPFAAPLLDSNHHFVLESVIRLRQCCGGFGYLQVAGFGGCIQRLTLRASDCFTAQIPESVQILKRLHYYSSSDDMESYFGDMLTKENAFNPSQIFSVFINICVNMRKSSGTMRKQVYLRHFMFQASLQILRSTQQFSRLPKHCLLFVALYYECSCYILQNGQFINWKFIEGHLTRQQYFQGIVEFQRDYLNKLIHEMKTIEEVLEVNNIRNVIMGRENSSQFYDEVLLTSKNNLRNSQEFIEYVKRPIVEFLTENNAKL